MLCSGNKTNKRILEAEAAFGFQLCESHVFFTKEVVESSALTKEVLQQIENLSRSSVEYLQCARGEDCKKSITGLDADIPMLLNAHALEVSTDTEKLFANLFSLIECVVTAIADADTSDIQHLLESYRDKRRATYKRLNWKKFIVGEYSYHGIAIEELFLALMYHFSKKLTREDLREYERWHGFSKGGVVMEGEVYRLTDSMKSHWDKLKQVA